MSYQDAVIYSITNTSNGKQYIGSTRDYNNRCRQHNGAMNNENDKTYQYLLYQDIRSLGIDKFEFKIIENYPCNDKDELREREDYYIQLYKPKYNSCRAYLSKEEVKELRHNYRESHKEEMKEYHRRYNELNKDKVSQRRYNYYQINKDKISIKGRSRYERNKDKINARASNKNICACGSISRISDITKHNKTIKHQNYLEDHLDDPVLVNMVYDKADDNIIVKININPLFE